MHGVIVLPSRPLSLASVALSLLYRPGGERHELLERLALCASPLIKPTVAFGFGLTGSLAR